jgi:hypothetical protein
VSKVDYYAVLGVGRGASQAQVARAFRRLAFRWHPDRNASQLELAHQQFLLVHQAYETLSDPLKRRAFDDSALARAVFETSEQTPAPAAPPRPKPPAGAPALRKARGGVGASRRPPPQAPLAPPRPSASATRTFMSRVSWLLLGGGIHALGFLAMLIIGPVAERRTSDDLHRQLPWFVDFVFPVGRIAIAAGLGTLAIWALNDEAIALRVPLWLLAIGALIFVIERLVLASFWVLGRGRSRRP